MRPAGARYASSKRRSKRLLFSVRETCGTIKVVRSCHDRDIRLTAPRMLEMEDSRSGVTPQLLPPERYQNKRICRCAPTYAEAPRPSSILTKNSTFRSMYVAPTIG